MEHQTRIDPLTGEEFVPKKKSQRFANPVNRIKYNNKRASELKQERAFFDKACHKSHIALKSLYIPNGNNIYNMYFLEGKGVDFKTYNHIEETKLGMLPAFYEFAIRQIPNTDNFQILKIC